MSGMAGDGELHPGKYNMALLRRAIREDWPIKPEIRAMVVTQMALVVGKSDDARNKIAAAKVIVAADSVNVRREALDLGATKEPDATTINVGVQLVNGANVADALQDPDYLEFLRVRRLAGHCDTSLVRGDGEPQPVANGQASGDIGSGAHGHAHGNGRH